MYGNGAPNWENGNPYMTLCVNSNDYNMPLLGFLNEKAYCVAMLVGNTHKCPVCKEQSKSVEKVLLSLHHTHLSQRKGTLNEEKCVLNLGMPLKVFLLSLLWICCVLLLGKVQVC